MDGQQLPGGDPGGSVRSGDTVRRASGPWTPAVHDLLRHLEDTGFAQAPRALGVDEAGREVLTHLPGETVGDARPWPAWAWSESALLQAAVWLRRYHAAVAGYEPPEGARWRLARRRWRPGDVIGHNDAAPYNAVWRSYAEPGSADGRLVGFVDWDLAAPCEPVWDLAHTAFTWVPLLAPDVAQGLGFAETATRRRRLNLLLHAYGWDGAAQDVLDAVRARVAAHVEDVEALAREDADAARPLGGENLAALRRALAALEAGAAL